MTEIQRLMRPPRLKREIGWAFLLALGVQTAGAFLWAGAASNRLSQLEKRSDAIEVLLERTARLEEQSIAMRTSLDRIERKIDRLGADESKGN
jgi:hypothetical protein